MITINNNTKHSQKTKDFFVSKQLKKSGINNSVKNGVITIKSLISESELEELKFVFDQYKVVKNLKNIITQKQEFAIIAYKIPNSDDFIIGKKNDGCYLVQTSDGIMEYTKNDMEEIYILDFGLSCLEKLTWAY